MNRQQKDRRAEIDDALERIKDAQEFIEEHQGRCRHTRLKGFLYWEMGSPAGSLWCAVCDKSLGAVCCCGDRTHAHVKRSLMEGRSRATVEWKKS